MQTSRFGPLNKLAAIASLALLAGFSAPGSAQTTTGCAPGPIPSGMIALT